VTTALDLQASYDRVAAEYADQFGDEMARKPFDRKLLDWLIEKVDGRGPICDLGCGPGQIARYLHSRGAPACGIDLSPEMVKHAQRLNPQIHFQAGNMLALTDIADNTFGGIAAFYSVIHVPRPQLPQALCELRRVLCSGGTLLVTFHIGEESKHLDELWGKPVNLDFNFYTTDWFKPQLLAAGFEVTEAIERDPYPESVEFQSRRAYLFAQKLDRTLGPISA
jgi:SAM-dependent methyltransferase